MIEILLRVLIVCHTFINESIDVILINIVVKIVRDRGADVGSVGRERRFKFRGGVVCLDFVNTLAWRLTDRPVEYLGSYEDLLAWGRQAGLLTPDETERIGLALMRLEETIRDIGGRFGLAPEDLNLDLGPLGRLL